MAVKTTFDVTAFGEINKKYVVGFDPAAPAPSGTIRVYGVPTGSSPVWAGWSADDIIDLFAKDLAMKRPA